VAVVCGGLFGTAAIGAPAGSLTLQVMWPLVALVNLPFDWASLGLTRALLRRGCEGDAPPFSPLWLGLLDFVLALVLLGLLAFALVGALVVADALTWRGGQEVAVDVLSVLSRIHDKPGDAANWWVYFTLFSTLVPSVVNMVVGSVSVTTFLLPTVRDWMIARIDELDAKTNGEGARARTEIVLLLFLHVVFGVLAAGLVLRLLWGLLWVLEPGVLRWFQSALLAWAKLLAFGLMS
jgi:hypothetical protein